MRCDRPVVVAAVLGSLLFACSEGSSSPASMGFSQTVWQPAMPGTGGDPSVAPGPGVAQPTAGGAPADPGPMMQPVAGMGPVQAPATEPMADPNDSADMMDPVDPTQPQDMQDMVDVPVMRADLGEGDGSDVIAIGDSWMNLITSGIQQSLVRVSGQPYRTYGVPGTRLLSEQIPGQYESAKGENPDIKTVVMTGGGNDIIQVPGLRDDCDAGGETCGVEVGKILDRLTSLWEEMAADGVQDVVYVQYSDPDRNEVDFALPDGDSVVTRCEAVPEPLRCHTLATDQYVMGDIPDTIHPSPAGFDRVAEAVYDLMVERGMRR